MGGRFGEIGCLTAAALAWLCFSAPSAVAGPPHFAPRFLFALGPHRPPVNLVFDYGGFHVDASAARRLQSPDLTVRAVQRQIDLVDHVGLSPSMLGQMRAQRIFADPTAQGEAAAYQPGRGVLIKIKRLDAKKPVLLVGLLKAYHDQYLATGDAGRDIADFRAEAARDHVWPKTALMLQSDTDYFALTGAAYLYGAITREPYSRADLRQTQPRYARWLAMLFDDGRPRG
jgi:hypothetical protein